MSQTYSTPEQKKKHADYMREYYWRNRDKIRLASRGYRAKSKSKKSEYDKKYLELNREKKRAYLKKWYAENKTTVVANYRSENRDRLAHNHKKWLQEHPIEVRAYRRARQAGIIGVKIAKEEIHNWESRICGICGLLVEDKYHLDHIIPLSRGGKHEVSNLQLAHPFCNQSKHDKLPSEYNVNHV